MIVPPTRLEKILHFSEHRSLHRCDIWGDATACPQGTGLSLQVLALPSLTHVPRGRSCSLKVTPIPSPSGRLVSIQEHEMSFLGVAEKVLCSFERSGFSRSPCVSVDDTSQSRTEICQIQSLEIVNSLAAWARGYFMEAEKAKKIAEKRTQSCELIENRSHTPTAVLPFL